MTIDRDDRPAGKRGKDPFQLQVRALVTVQKHDGTLLNGQPTYNVDDDWDTFEGLQRREAYFEAKGGRQKRQGQSVKGVSRGTLTILRPGPKWLAVTPKMRVKMEDTGRYTDTTVIIRTFEIEAAYQSTATVYRDRVRTFVIRTLETR